MYPHVLAGGDSQWSIFLTLTLLTFWSDGKFVIFHGKKFAQKLQGDEEDFVLSFKKGPPLVGWFFTLCDVIFQESEIITFWKANPLENVPLFREHRFLFIWRLNGLLRLPSLTVWLSDKSNMKWGPSYLRDNISLRIHNFENWEVLWVKWKHSSQSWWNTKSWRPCEHWLPTSGN